MVCRAERSRAPTFVCMQTTATKSKAATNAAEPTFELNNRAYVLLEIMVAHDEFNSPEEAARYCTAGGVASLIESMKEDETLEIFGCEKDGAK